MEHAGSDIPAYPDDVVRKVVVNALFGKDVRLNRSDNKPASYKDFLAIISPGKLPNGITTERMPTDCHAARNQLMQDLMRNYVFEHMGDQ